MINKRKEDIFYLGKKENGSLLYDIEANQTQISRNKI